MKQLLFTFFAFLLCYSLFFDKEPRSSVVDELNYINEDAFPAVYMAEDTLGSYTYMYNYSIVNNQVNIWKPLTVDKVMKIPFNY